MEVNTKGAELHTLHSTDGPEKGWLWDGGAAWVRRAPVCFPWCGRLKDGWFEENGTRYEGGIHGLLRDMEHTVLAQGDGTLTLRAESDADALSHYPWKFRADTTHTLEKNRVVTSVCVTNLDQRAMPIQFGFHTALRCPFTPDQTPEDYQLRFEQEETPIKAICVGGLITGELQPVFTGQSLVPLDVRMFDADSICLTGLKSRWIQLEEKRTGRAVRIGVEGYPCVILWSPIGIPGLLCIEPWHGKPSQADGGHSLWERPDTMTLEPGASFSAVQTLDLVP